MVDGKRKVVERLIQHEAKLSAVSPSRLYSLSAINHTIYKKKHIICFIVTLGLECDRRWPNSLTHDTLLSCHSTLTSSLLSVSM